MKTIAIIPARGGSKRLPNKNILMLGGIPLLAHSILYAQKHSFIDEVIVSTDSLQIQEVALSYGAKVIIRPDNLSGDFEPTVTALKHVLEHHEKVENVILLQATNPLRPENLLIEAFTYFENNQLDSLFTVSRNNNKLGKISDNRFIPFNYEIGQRSQDLEPLFYENGLLYITTPGVLQEDVVFNADAIPFEVNHPFAQIDIDTLADFEYAEYVVQKQIS
jgi:N-acylneuraminate cytidylyltransferase